MTDLDFPAVPAPLGPMVLNGRVYDDIFAAGARLIGLLRRMAALGAGPEMYPLCMDGREEDRFATCMARPDMVIDATGPKFVEFNIGGGVDRVVDTATASAAWIGVYGGPNAPFTAPDPLAVRDAFFRRAAADLKVRPAVALVGSMRDVRCETTRHFDLQIDWSSRLRLVAMPECALTTPDMAACRVKTPVTGARNDRVKHRVIADVDLPPGGADTRTATGAMVLAATAEASGPSGDYKATSLSPSGSWSAGGNSGSMNWSYGIGVPPAIGGTAPTVNLGYNSGSVDGRTTSSNNQASWIGEGWEYSPGFVERSYQSCTRDGQDKSGEKCWSTQNSLTLSLNGKSSTLIQDDTDKTKWRLEGDDDSRIEPLTGAANGDDNGEHWRLTTGDGVQYYFGIGHKPGGDNTDPATNSTWTAPVYGNNTGEPCNKPSGFDASWCQQAWRWNLDYVVDPRGGMVTYWYNTETNRYTRGAILVGSGTLTEYVRGGTLARITYGSKKTDTTRPTAQIVFDTAERCLKKDGFDCDPPKMTKANAAKWPDVPVDKQCATTGTCEEYGQTFSSYTPTIRALRHARRHRPHQPAADLQSLIVAMPTTPGHSPLPYASEEVHRIRALLPHPVQLAEPDGADRDDALRSSRTNGPTAATVLAHLPRCAIAHFACHGESNQADPSRSRLLLHDHATTPLTVSALARVDLDHARLAYLSACSTTDPGDLRLLEEAIHLTSAFQLAGFPHVVGTQWPIDDRLAVEIAESFYTHLTTGPPGTLDPDQAATALHHTIRAVRDRYPATPSLWAGYLHTGA
ncbi:CHAT domain-containing protein [Embleya sp. NPDC005575]|uniref:CHAT domain-containing protein n=1 Tax=Embleya sp. NPDC005575 TaxID=3156892 RepID=UPI0033B300B1